MSGLVQQSTDDHVMRGIVAVLCSLACSGLAWWLVDDTNRRFPTAPIAVDMSLDKLRSHQDHWVELGAWQADCDNVFELIGRYSDPHYSIPLRCEDAVVWIETSRECEELDGTVVGVLGKEYYSVDTPKEPSFDLCLHCGKTNSMARAWIAAGFAVVFLLGGLYDLGLFGLLARLLFRRHNA